MYGRLGRGVFTFGEDFSPCRLQASLTRSAAQMRTPLLASSLGERSREPLTVAIKIGLPARSRPFLLAQEEGFEPPCLLGKRFSRPPRCDRFDIPAYHNARCRIMISSPISKWLVKLVSRIRFAYPTKMRQARL